MPPSGVFDCTSHRSGHRPPGHSLRWKHEAFLELQRRLPEKLVTNLIVVGDSEFEMAAAKVMHKQFQHSVLKSVKLISHPTPVQLIAQMEVVSRSFSRIAATTDNTRINLYGRRS